MTSSCTCSDTSSCTCEEGGFFSGVPRMTPGPAAVPAENPYVPWPAKILQIVSHTAREHTFRMEFTGDVRPGQFFEVSIPKYGEAPISVSGIEPGRSIDLTIRNVGRVTGELFEGYGVGDEVLLRGPYGNGFDTSMFMDGEVVVVAGGTGVSPVRGVVEALSHAADAKDKHVIVGFRSPADMLFRDDLARWADALDLILTVDGAPEGYEGNIGLVTKYIPDLPLRDPATAQAIVVGPPPMMRFSVKGLLELGLQEKNIWLSQERKMCCGMGKCGHCRIGARYVCLDGPVFNYIESKDMLD